MDKREYRDKVNLKWRKELKQSGAVKKLRNERHLDLNVDVKARTGRGEQVREGRKGRQEGSWPWMQTDRQGNQRQAVTFSAAGGSKALFKGLVNAGCCWGISLTARRLITTVIQLSNPNPPPTHTQDRTHSGHLGFYTVLSRGWTEETTASAAANFTVQQTVYSVCLMCSALSSTCLFCLWYASYHCPIVLLRISYK